MDCFIQIININNDIPHSIDHVTVFVVHLNLLTTNTTATHWLLTHKTIIDTTLITTRYKYPIHLWCALYISYSIDHSVLVNLISKGSHICSTCPSRGPSRGLSRRLLVWNDGTRWFLCGTKRG